MAAANSSSIVKSGWSSDGSGGDQSMMKNTTHSQSDEAADQVAPLRYSPSRTVDHMKPPALSRTGSLLTDPNRRRSVSLTTSAEEAARLVDQAQRSHHQLQLAEHPKVRLHRDARERLDNKAKRKASIGAFSPSDKLATPIPSSRRRAFAPLNRVTVELRTVHGAVLASAPGLVKRLARAPFRCLNGENVKRADNGFDDQHANLILHIRDEVVDNLGRPLTVLDMLGSGTYGQVIKARYADTKQIVALKIIKNIPAYAKQSRMEVTALSHIARHHRGQPDRLTHIVRLVSDFQFSSHLCTVYELGGPTLYDLLKQRGLKGMRLVKVKHYSKQLLGGLTAIHEAGICHADLKPENVLVNVDMQNWRRDIVKIIDFGSAFTTSTHHYYSYMQSRYYRAPETLLGLLRQGVKQREFDFGTAMDMWSTACIMVELFLGRPMFCGSCHWDHLRHFDRVLGSFPPAMLQNGHLTSCFYRVSRSTGKLRLRTYDEMKAMADRKTKLEPSSASPRSRFGIERLTDIMSQNKEDLSSFEERRFFVDLLSKLFVYEPGLRYTAHQALEHAWLKDDVTSNPVTPSKVNKRVRPVKAPDAPLSAMPPRLASPFTNPSSDGSTAVATIADGEAVVVGESPLRQPKPAQPKQRADPAPPLLVVRSPSGKIRTRLAQQQTKTVSRLRLRRSRAATGPEMPNSDTMKQAPAIAVMDSNGEQTVVRSKRGSRSSNASTKLRGGENETQREINRLKAFLQAPPSPALSDTSAASAPADENADGKPRPRLQPSLSGECTSSSGSMRASDSSQEQERESRGEYRLSAQLDWQGADTPSTVQIPVLDRNGNLMYLVPSRPDAVSQSSSTSSMDLPPGMVAASCIDEAALLALQGTVPAVPPQDSASRSQSSNADSFDMVDNHDQGPGHAKRAATSSPRKSAMPTLPHSRSLPSRCGSTNLSEAMGGRDDKVLDKVYTGDDGHDKLNAGVNADVPRQQAAQGRRRRSSARLRRQSATAEKGGGQSPLQQSTGAIKVATLQQPQLPSHGEQLGQQRVPASSDFAPTTEINRSLLQGPPSDAAYPSATSLAGNVATYPPRLPQQHPVASQGSIGGIGNKDLIHAFLSYRNAGQPPAPSMNAYMQPPPHPTESLAYSTPFSRHPHALAAGLLGPSLDPLLMPLSASPGGSPITQREEEGTPERPDKHHLSTPSTSSKQGSDELASTSQAADDNNSTSSRQGPRFSGRRSEV
eukprot:TRINITY_DN11932_c0_g2_i3.p1 TRINITY_DN11932_c0_g2~~TRINITY_DN11932_c0_g2_i3.p1  ORF type:complete len:1226 (+),score=295.69 TRINITY_DN11932_c0_g2_i3:491-4168(+)